MKMEALGATTSVFAITTVALQSSKIIYETVRGIKNGPKEVKELALEVQQLGQILEQVTEVSKKNSDRNAKNIFELQGVIDRCRQNLDDFQKKFEKFEISSEGRKLGKAWKRVKHVVQREDFRRMGRTTNYYVNTLGVYLILIGREMDDNNKTAFARSIQQSAADSLLLKQNNRMLMQIEKSLSTVGTGLARQETQRHISIDMIRAGSQAAESLSERLTAIPNMSQNQGEILLEKLVQLQTQVEELRSAVDQASKIHPSTVEFSDNLRKKDENSYPSKELSECVNRLCSLATKPKRTVFSYEAQCIISDIEKILIMVSKRSKFAEKNEKRKVDQRTELEYSKASKGSQQELDLKRMQGLLTSSQLISVNQQVHSCVNFSSEDRRHRKTTVQHYVTELGLVFVQTKRRRLISNVEPQDAILADEADQGVIKVFEGTISLIAEREISRTKISTSFLQKSTANGYFSLKPTLTFCAIIPDTSPIFTLARKGNLAGIINHVQQGQASLTDCDSKGRTLLNYASRNCQVEVSKFLIEKGADVDAVEYGLFDDEVEDFMVDTPLQLLLHTMSTFGNLRKDDTETDLYRRCSWLFLDAGADPTIEPENPEHGAMSFLHRTMVNNRPVSILSILMNLTKNNQDLLRITLDLSAEFISLEDSSHRTGYTKLIYYLHTHGCRVDPQCIKLLLNRGADATAKDNEGRTCLHLIFLDDRPENVTSVRESVVLLIQAGADIYATTNDGESVSDIAYKCRRRPKNTNWDDKLISWEDVWEEILAACGYDAASFHESFSKRYLPFLEEQKENSDVDEGSSENRLDVDERNSESDEKNLDVGKRRSESNEKNSGVNGQSSKLYGQDFEDINVRKRNFQRSKQCFEDFGGDRGDTQNNERNLDVVMQDSNKTSSRYDRSTSKFTQSRFALPGIEESMNVNIWNQADCRPKGDLQRPLNSQDGSSWVEDLFDADTERGWNANPLSQIAPSTSSSFQNNTIFEIEEGAEDWNTIWG